MAADQGSRSVILVESDAAFAEQIRMNLEPFNLDVRILSDGAEALRTAKAAPPSLILLCVELPGVSGYSICNKLKKHGALKAVPLVIMSSEATPQIFDQHRKLKTRAEEYLIKPFAMSTLLEKLGALIELQVPDSDLTATQTLGFDEDSAIEIETDDAVTHHEVTGQDQPQEYVIEDPTTVQPDVDDDISSETDEAFAMLEMSSPDAGAPGPIVITSPDAPREDPQDTPEFAIDPDGNYIDTDDAIEDSDLIEIEPAPEPESLDGQTFVESQMGIEPPPARPARSTTEEQRASAPAGGDDAALQQEIAQIRGERDELALRVGTLEHELQEAQSASAAVDDDRVSELEQELEQLRAEAERARQLEQEIEQLRSGASAEAVDAERIAQLEQENALLRGEGERLGQLEQEAVQWEQEANRLQAELEQLRDAGDAGDGDAALADLQTEKQALQARVTELESAAASSFSHDREMLNLREVINRKEKEVLDLKDDLDGKERQILDHKDKVRELERRARDSEEKVLHFEKELVSARERVEALEKDKAKLNEREDQTKKRLEQAKEEIDKAYAEIDELKQVQAQELERLNTKHRGDIEALQAETEATVEATKNQHLADLEALRESQAEEKQSLAEQHEGALAEAAETSAAALASLRAEHERELGELRASQAQDVERLRGDAERTLRERDELHQQQTASAQASHEQATDELRASLTAEHQQQMDQLREEQEQALQQRDDQHREALERRDAEHAGDKETLRTEQQAELDRMRGEHQRILDQLREQHQQLTDDTNQQHEAAVQQLQQEHAAELDRLREEHDAEQARVSQEHADIVTGMRTRHDETLENVRQEHATAVARLEGMIADRDGDLGQARDAIADRERQIEELQAQVANYEEQLLNAYGKIRHDEQLTEKAQRAMAIAITLLEKKKLPEEHDAGEDDELSQDQAQ